MKNSPRIAVSAILTALAWLMVAPPAQSETLGRLFLTPERRAALERQRQLNIQEKPQETLAVDKVHLNGVVYRNDNGGKTTVWVNGRPQRDGENNSGIALRPSPGEPGRMAISVGDEKPAHLRIGETLNRGTQEKTDGLAGGQLQINPGHDAKRP
ncbi:MAG: hypothetical protein HY066_00345 [Betaproteobacteria bacterium]|nr:hypothetical protein [Betaproteobacteria bacterium]